MDRQRDRVLHPCPTSIQEMPQEVFKYSVVSESTCSLWPLSFICSFPYFFVQWSVHLIKKGRACLHHHGCAPKFLRRAWEWAAQWSERSGRWTQKNWLGKLQKKRRCLKRLGVGGRQLQVQRMIRQLLWGSWRGSWGESWIWALLFLIFTVTLA